MLHRDTTDNNYNNRKQHKIEIMKKHILYFLPALAVLFGFTACTSDDITDGGQQQTEVTGDDVIVKAGIGANSVFTRSNPIGTEAEQRVFNSGDMIRIYDESGNDCYYKLEGTVWNYNNNKFGGAQLKWDTDKKSFYAAYPQDIDENRARNNYYKGKDDFWSGVYGDQSEAETLALCDVMYADTATNVKPNNHTITLNFKRQTARIILKFNFNEQFQGLNPSVSDLKVNGVWNYSSGRRVGDRGDFIPYHDTTNNQYIVLVFPQEKDDAQPFLKLTVQHAKDAYGSESEVLTLTGIPALDKGMSYTFNVLVGKEKVSIGNVSVNDWGDGGTLGTGEASETYK